ncbi:MAG: ABC transporter permease [Bryobacteraceae bacterium]
MRHNLIYGLRQIRRNLLFSSIAVVLLATGIGANTVIFSFIEALLLKPLPVREPRNLYLLEQLGPHRVRPETDFEYSQFLQLTKRTDLFAGLIAESAWRPENQFPLTDSSPARLVMTQIVSPNYFRELGIHAVLGRVLSEADARDISNIPVMLSYQFWKSQFGGSRGAIGRVLRIKNFPFVVAGVLPESFHSIDIERAPDVRLPVSAARVLFGHEAWDSRREDWYSLKFQILARPDPGISPAQAAAAIEPQLKASTEWSFREWASHLAKPFPAEAQRNQLDWLLEFHPFWQSVANGTSQLRVQFSNALSMLMGAASLLMLVACLNIAGLLVVKSEARRKEIALRASLGAGRLRIICQLATEYALLAVPGMALGLAFAYVAGPILLSLFPPARDTSHVLTPHIISVTPDWRVVLFSAGVALLSLLVFGILPAWRATRLDLNVELKLQSRSSTRFTSGLTPIALQAAFGVVLIFAAVQMLHTYWNLQHLDPGFNKTNLVEFTIDPGSAGYSAGKLGLFFKTFKDRVESLPGVQSAAYAQVGIMRGTGMKMTVAPRGVVLPKQTFLNTTVNNVSPGYFETMGIQLLGGRNLTLSDTATKPMPIIVNQAFAEFFFPRQNPVGKLMVSGTDGTKPPGWIIVGVSATAKFRSLRESDPPILYGALDESKAPNPSMVLYVRTRNNPDTLIHEVRQALRQIDATVPLTEVETMSEEVQTSLWQERLVAILACFFGVVALFFAAIGLYAALAYSVAQRARELGIRLAIGAQMHNILATVCGRICVAVSSGLAAGALASLITARLLGHLLYDVHPRDPIAIAAALTIVGLSASAAAAIPGWRAVHTDAATALREE